MRKHQAQFRRDRSQCVIAESLERRVLLSTASLIKDINTTTLSSYPHGQLQYNGALYFLAYNPADGYGLWRSDGTAAGTSIVKSVTPRPGASVTTGWPDLVQSGGLLYFSNLDVDHGWELWKSDGTSAGTQLVKDLFPGPADSDPTYFGSINGQLLFFTRDDIGGKGLSLWKTDGTDAGTQLVTTIPSSTDYWNISDVTVAGNLFFFRVYSLHGTFTPSVYRSDGTPGGTFLLFHTPAQTTVSGTTFFPFGNRLGYVGLLSNTPTLYLTDGTAGNLITLSLSPTATTVSSTVLGVMRGNVYLGANNFGGGSTLWKCDGSVTTSLGATSTFASTDAAAMDGTKVYVSASGGNARYLYQAFSTSHGQVAVFPSFNTAIGGLFYSQATQLMYFTAGDATAGNELWESDGTQSGTVRVADISAGTTNSGASHFFDFHGSFCFTADDGLHGMELWSTDGTTPGTHLLAGVNQGTDLSVPAAPIALGNSLLFGANDGIHGQELWKTDGTAAGTVLVKDIFPASPGRFSSSGPMPMGVIDGWVYFAAKDANGEELWKTDGTTANTVMVKAVNPNGNLGIPQAVTMNGVLYFGATDATNVYQLWRSDGTAGGTYPLTSGAAVGASIYGKTSTAFLVVLNNTLIFAGAGYGLWKSDGTVSGTVRLGSSSIGFVNNLCVSGGSVYFTCRDYSAALYKTDGTDAGTVRVAYLNSNFDSVSNLPTDVNGAFYFVQCIDYPTSHSALWKSDGTPGGTVQVADTNPTGTALIFSLTNLNGDAAFTAYDGTETSLWISGPAGTRMLAAPGPGPQLGVQGNLTAIDGRLYFSADDGVNGAQPWVSDGTASGTMMMQVVTPPGLNHFPLFPIGGSKPTTFTPFAAGIFVSIQDDLHGREPWLLTVDVSNLALAGSNVYLKEDPDGVNLDAWVDSATAGTGTPTRKAPFAALTSVAVTGGAADDSLTLDFSGGNPFPPTGVSYDGAGGVNTVNFIGTAGDDTVTADPNTITFTTDALGAVPITASNVQTIRFAGGSGGE